MKIKIHKGAKKLFLFLKKNYLISLFIIFLVLAGIGISIKSLDSHTKYVYVTVKVSQGLWWASTLQPAIWYADTINPGLKESSNGKVSAEILSVKKYPRRDTNQFDIYLTMRLRTIYDASTSKYFFKRSIINVATPVEFEFPETSISGTVLELSENVIDHKIDQHIVYLRKEYEYPWQYDQILVGDIYSDGQKDTLTILDKKAEDVSVWILDAGSSYSGHTEKRKNVTIKVAMDLEKDDYNYIWGVEQIIQSGRLIDIPTNTMLLTKYTIQSVE